MDVKEKSFLLINDHFEMIWCGGRDLSISGIRDKMNRAKQCALITVDEIIKSKPIGNSVSYWEEVYKEIENYEIP